MWAKYYLPIKQLYATPPQYSATNSEAGYRSTHQSNFSSNLENSHLSTPTLGALALDISSLIQTQH